MTKAVVILTLEKHKEGVWITRLVKELTRRFENDKSKCSRARSDEGNDEQQGKLRVQVVAVESLDVDQCPLSSPPAWAGLVNRVSDAASPNLAKLTLSILQTAELWGTPIFNGARPYAICYDYASPGLCKGWAYDSPKCLGKSWFFESA